jgi:subtilisin
VSYRVFPDVGGATNYDVMRAVARAALGECDILNLSLGTDHADPVVRHAVELARSKGCLVVVASGNDDRAPVNYPAAWPACVAVSALGEKGTFPDTSTEAAEIAKPFSKSNRNRFMAAFSNVGPEIDVTGPGVGVISTVPGGYAPMSGTSMACPAVAGFAAALLSRSPAIRSMPRTLERAKALEELLFRSAQFQEMGRNYEGRGLPL